MRKSLSELLQSNERSIKERIVERVCLMEMFRHKNAGAVSGDVSQKFCKTYQLRDIE